MQTMYVTCNVCDGSGKNPLDLTDRMVCWKCHGEGMMYVMTNTAPDDQPAEDVQAEVEAAAEDVTLEQILRRANTRLDEILTDRDKAKAEIERLENQVEELSESADEAQAARLAAVKELTDERSKWEAERLQLLGSIVMLEGERDDARKALQGAMMFIEMFTTDRSFYYDKVVKAAAEILKTK